MRPGETPVNIPNTKVKPRTADDTVPAAARESRWLPEHTEKMEKTVSVFTGGRSIRGVRVLRRPAEEERPCLYLENFIQTQQMKSAAARKERYLILDLKKTSKT